MSEADRQVHDKWMSMPEPAKDKLTDAVFDDIVYECMMEIIYETHREDKLERQICQVCRHQCRAFGRAPGLDIYGQNPANTNGEKYECEKCKTKQVPSRYAPHLENCLGLGRRQARQRNATASDRASPAPFPNESDTEKDSLAGGTKKKRKDAGLRKEITKKRKANADADSVTGSSPKAKKVKTAPSSPSNAQRAPALLPATLPSPPQRPIMAGKTRPQYAGKTRPGMPPPPPRFDPIIDVDGDQDAVGSDDDAVGSDEE
ncbi:Ataxin-7-like protein 3 [Rhizophlyctis rosea]|nr:Ataxin-7-like protein 3 [Rhizophlyctis rosea]